MSVTQPFELEFMRVAMGELLLLSVLAGLVGPWIVLRRLAFFTHGIGTATFPGLVLAGPLGVAPMLAALIAASLYAAGHGALSRAARVPADVATGLLLVAALALGVVLASDVVSAGAGVDRLLFGSLIGLAAEDVWLTAAATAGMLVVDTRLRRLWLAEGFDPGGAKRLQLPWAALSEQLLLVSIAVACVVALAAVGALLVAAVLVIPAATVRLTTSSLRALRMGSVALAAGESVVALWLAYALNAAPGPALAVVGGSVFAATAVVTAAMSRRSSMGGRSATGAVTA